MNTIERRRINLRNNIVNEALGLTEAQFKHGDTRVPVDIANQLWKYGLIQSYMNFEIALRRRKNPNIFFIAAPVEYLAQHLDRPENYILRYPFLSPKNIFKSPEFGLIIEAEGVQKAILQLRDLETTYIENLRRLKSTGILYPKNVAHENIVFSR